MCTASFVWSHNCVPCLPIPCIGPDVLSQCQISQKLISPNPCPLSFILNSSQYSSLLDHLLISFPLWFLSWHLTILSQPDLYAFTFFLPLFFFFFFCKVRGSIFGPSVQIVVMSQFLEQITEDVFWHLTKPINCVILSLMLFWWVQLFKTHYGNLPCHCTVLSPHYSPMNECLVFATVPVLQLGFDSKQCITLFFFQSWMYLYMYVCAR